MSNMEHDTERCALNTCVLILRIYALELVSLVLEQMSYEKEQAKLASGAGDTEPYGFIQQLEVVLA